MAYTKYSLTPANNTAAPPDGAPEGMLPSAVNDTMRDMMAQIRDCGDGIRDGTYTMTAPKITGGTITGVTFTSIVVTGGSITGTTVTSNTFSSSGATITGGTINSTAIGGTTAAAGKFTTLEATGVTTVQAGTVSLPAITTSGDTNTGIFFPAADTIAFSEGGAESMRIDSSGNVGIGITSPTARLHVYGGSNNQFKVESSGAEANFTLAGTSYGQINNSVGDWYLTNDASANIIFRTASTERMRITSGGYTKMSNTGSYAGSTDAYHEMRSDANNPTVVVTNTNGSFGAQAQQIKITRSSTSGYVFLLCESGGGADTEFNFRGDGNAYADGTFNNNGADYAEYFESATGQTIPVGSTVVLDGNKVRLATASDNVDDVIGVVRPKEPSKASMVVGNTAWNKWANKYLTDDFDRYIMEDHNIIEWVDEDGKQHYYESHNVPANVIVPTDAVVKTHDDKGNKFQHYKLNPEWNPDSEYINRENREEWLIIGLIGQVKVLKEQKMGSRWVKMRDVSASVEEWFIR